MFILPLAVKNMSVIYKITMYIIVAQEICVTEMQVNFKQVQMRTVLFTHQKRQPATFYCFCLDVCSV
jgi:hypothetical protein